MSMRGLIAALSSFAARRRPLAAALMALLIAGSVGASEPWTAVAQSRVAGADGPKILLIYDMEGLSGQDDIGSFSPSDPAYAQGQRLLTDDVNAVIEGLIAGGAKEVRVADRHGSSSHIDILVEQIDSRARMVTESEQKPDTTIYDGVATVGMHAKSGSGGFAAHTWTAGVEFRINGRPVNETELVALTYGEKGMPVIFVSGDDRLGEELATLPWIEYVAVKDATGMTTARLHPLKEAHERLSLGAKRAVQHLAHAKLAKASTPVQASVTAFPPADLAWLAEMPGIRYQNQTVSFTAPDASAAYRGMQAIGTAAMTGYGDALYRAMQSHPEGKAMELKAIAEWDAKWLASELERAKAGGRDKY